MIGLRTLMVASCTIISLLTTAHSLVAQENIPSVGNTQGKSHNPQEAAPQTNMAQGPNYKVNVTSVVEKSTLEGKIVYEIAYSYEFEGRNTVYVRGLGTIPAKGKFSYLTSDLQLEFLESASGPVLAAVQLEETIRTMGSDSTELPKENDFPQAFRSSTWTPPPTFSEAAVKVIQKYFPSGYNPRQAGQVNYYITTYRNLQVPDRNLRSQIAVSISQPYDIAGDRLTYRVQFVARDRPRLSDTWRYGDERSQLTIDAAYNLINNLIAELTAAGGKQQ